jgi:hypothetical protein
MVCSGGSTVSPSKEVLTKLIGSVYDAAVDATLWETFLGKLAKTCRADSAALVMHRVGCEVHTVAASWKTDPDADRLYRQHYGSIDVWAMRGQSRLGASSCTSDRLCPLEELLTTEFYNDFLLRYHIVHGMFGLVERNPNRWACVSLYRGSLSNDFRVSDLGTLDLLMVGEGGQIFPKAVLKEE